LKTDGLITELFKRIKSEIVGKNVCKNQGKGAPQHKISVEIREIITSHFSFKPSTPPSLPEKKCSECEILAFFADNPVYVL